MCIVRALPPFECADQRTLSPSPSARGAHVLTRGEERKERAATEGEEMTRAMDEAATGADETAAATVDEVVTVATSTLTRTASSIDARKRRRQSSSSVMRGFRRGDAMVMGSVVEEYRRSLGLQW
jgi:hypothetical protein